MHFLYCIFFKKDPYNQEHVVEVIKGYISNLDNLIQNKFKENN